MFSSSSSISSRATFFRSVSLRAAFVVNRSKYCCLSMNDTHTHSHFILQTWPAQSNLEMHAYEILKLSPYSRSSGHCRKTILSQSAQSAVPHCKRLCPDSVVSCSVIVRTLTWLFIPNFVLIPWLFRDGFGKRFAFDKIWTQSVFNQQETAMNVTILIRYSIIYHDNHEFPECNAAFIQ